MRYIKPDYFEDFSCVAGACPDTCCAGWQIMIDEDSLEYYGKVQGEFGKRLRNSIDWQEGAFYQCNRRCAFLNEKDLCDIYTELGEGALCNTCKNYPRHVEEYEGLRELSLSLSCPIAAKMILEQTKFPVFEETEDEAWEDLAEEFEDFDVLLFTQLEDARSWMLKHLQEAAGALDEKMELYLQFAREMQDCINREEYYEIDTVIRGYEAGAYEVPDYEAVKARRFAHRKALYAHMCGLERLREEWTLVLKEAEMSLYNHGESLYRERTERFEAYLKQGTKVHPETGSEAEAMSEGRKMTGLHQEGNDMWGRWEQVGTNLFVFFLYTYFCGAVYDDWIYSKLMLAVESVRFIRELYMARWLQKGKLTEADFVELAYRYAREIEHSDQNLNELEEIFGQNV